MSAPRPCGDYYREPIEDTSYDPFFISDADFARISARADDITRRNAEFNARRGAAQLAARIKAKREAEALRREA